MKRYLIAGAVALTLGAGTFAFANSLTVNSDTLASGTDPVASGCESVDVSYTTTYSTTLTPYGYELDEITLTGGTGCTTQTFTVDVATAAGVSMHQFTGTLSGGNAVIDASTFDLDAALVEHVSAVLTN